MVCNRARGAGAVIVKRGVDRLLVAIFIGMLSSLRAAAKRYGTLKRKQTFAGLVDQFRTP